jgi:hypothetical protein
VDELIRMTFPHPPMLPAGRRRRFWMQLGEPRRFGDATLTLLMDSADGELQRPYFGVTLGDRVGQVPIQPIAVPGKPGVTLCPRAVKLRAPRVVTVLMELRAETDAASLEQVA